MAKRKVDFKRLKQRIVAACIGGVLPLCLFLGQSAWANDFTDDELKAVYLFRFAYLVNWENVTVKDGIYHYCVDGMSEVAHHLKSISEQKKQKARFWNLADEDQSAHQCHIIFTTSRKEEQILSLRTRFPDSLLVGDGKTFVANGGMASFIKMNNRVRPYIDMHNLLGVPFTLRSQLLSIAVTKGEVKE
ncbi:YfiR family protein [Enterovibrio sp. ZSDZ35]|uniref:YfiR family protein n=1 Tax=Enterovibrio qingdaonensis TaxID=2899818 RepID=A0ABT5QH66_9GAMM|nr:YfiR family protein [Enterovibrio sp. ZSDZ35]MDD1780325.1 YfiR family protein [Enterovibrio sp. ZSDZ35]